jgi:hypothetical protein
MKISLSSKDRLTVSVDESKMAKFLLVVLVVFTIMSFRKFSQESDLLHKGWFIAFLISCVFLFGAVLATFEKATFEFNTTTQIVLWKRKRIWSQRSGGILFSSIRDIGVQGMVGDCNRPLSRRVVIFTDSEQIPIRIAYMPDNNSECLKIAEQLKQFIGKPTTDMVTDNVRELALSGQKMDAIRLVRKERGISLEEAIRLVDNINKK